MEQRVAEAALAMVRASTDADTRRSASRFLEEWTRTEQAWEIYAKWLSSFVNPDNAVVDAESIGIQLLCLQLLQAKIRREIRRQTPAATADQCLVTIRTFLFSLVQLERIPEAVFGSACICLVALTLRCGDVSDLVQSCCHAMATNRAALRLLSHVPSEMVSYSGLTLAQVSAELRPYADTIIECARHILRNGESEAVVTETMGMLHSWIKVCHISIARLNSPISDGSETVLAVLIKLLSPPSGISNERLLVLMSQAFTEACLVPADSFTEPRSAACNLMFQAFAHGFIAAPLQYATEMQWEDACHALASLVCTMVTEEIDNLVSQPAEHILNLLLRIQNHNLVKVRLTVLECWLTVQEIPTSQRHENWKVPLYTQVVHSLFRQMAYPDGFRAWEQEADLDQSDFDEFRRMVKDVLVSAYFLLRASFIVPLVQLVTTSTDWSVQESALAALSDPAREICARIKSRSGGSSLLADQEQTLEQLLLVVHFLVGGGDPTTAVESAWNRHPLLLEAVARFLGAYCPVWSTKCAPEANLQLVSYLGAVYKLSYANAASYRTSVILEASRTIRSLLIGAANLLLSDTTLQSSLLKRIGGLVEAVLSTNEEESMVTVAEGCTRMIMHIKDDAFLRHALRIIVTPLLQRCEMSINAIPPDSPPATDQALLAADALGRYLHVLQVIIRFTDKAATGSNPITEVITAIWPLLEHASQRVMYSEPILANFMSIHEQLLKNVPEIAGPQFQPTVKYVLEVFEATKHASTLDYMACAVEMFGPSEVHSFQELLSCVADVLFVELRQHNGHAPNDLIASFFQLNQRYILYCPGALVTNSHFPSIVACSVDCLSACQGERDSSRSSLIFISQLFGWRSLRLSTETMNQLERLSQVIYNELVQHGRRIVQLCLGTLVNGPQMLSPACSDCILSVLSSPVSWGPVLDNPAQSSLAVHWLALGRPDSSNLDLYQQVCAILLQLLREHTSKPKARMLLADYSKIHNGEMSVDALMAYSL